MEVPTQLAVVERDSLLTSDREGYPQEYQDKIDRDKGAGGAQIEKIGQSPNAGMLGASETSDLGAPIAWRDADGRLVVIAGNGRVLGLRAGDAKYKSTGNYDDFARRTAERFNLPGAEGLAHPTLVRVIDTDLSRDELVKFALASNRSTLQEKNDADNMRSDGLRIDAEMAAKIAPDVSAGVMDDANAGFVSAFLAAANGGALTDAEGRLNNTGMRRLRDALLGSLLVGHPAANSIITTLQDPQNGLGIDNVLNGLKDAAIHLAALRGRKEWAAYDLSADIADALKDYIDFRRSGMADINDFLGQQDMFAQRPSLTEAIMREVFARRNSARRVTALFDAYAKTAMMQDDAPALFDMGATPREEIWKLAVEKVNAEPPADVSRRMSIEAAPTAEERDALTLHNAIEATREIPMFRPASGLLAELVGGYRRGDPQIEKRIIDWAMGIIPDPVTNPAVGEIRTSRGSIRSILHHVRDARSRGPLKVLALEHMEEILQNAVLVDEGDDNGDHFYNLAHRLSFDGTPYIARVAVRRDRNGNITYDVEFSRKDRLSNAPATGTGASANASAKPAHSTTEILLQRAYSVKRYSISGLYTGSAADYAERVPVLDKDGNITGYRIDNAPSLKHVGTGEGAQVYGWGLYASTERGVAEGYANSDRAKKNLARRPNDIFIDGQKQRNTMTPEGVAADAFDKAEGDREKAAAELREHVSRMRGWLDSGKIKGPKIIGMYRRMIARDQGAIRLLEDKSKEFSRTVNSPTPRAILYEQTFFTDRAPGDESHLLKWYKPVSEEQGRWIEEGAKNAGIEYKWTEETGADLYRHLVAQFKQEYDTENDAARRASEFLSWCDIDGVKYPVDSFGGKGMKDGDVAGWNYVSFRDDNIRVDHKWVDGVQRYSVEVRNPWPADFPNATVMTTRKALMARHGDLFDKAKKGDMAAAGDLVDAIMSEPKYRAKLVAIKARHPNAEIACPVHAEEEGGRNKIPFALAAYAARELGLKVDTGIVQNVRAHHTGKDAFYRLTHRARFDGTVEAGKEYVLVDDHITQGGTLNELRNYIENNGGRVVDIFSLTASQGSTILKPSEKQLAELRERYGDELGQLLEDGDIAADPRAITASEAAYILKLSPDTFRNRVAEARQERDGRILQEALGHRLSVEAANVAAAKTEAQRVLDRIGGTELGNAVNRDFKGEGQSTIIGRTVRTAGDLAAAAQIYRNPCFETFRYFFTKGDKVVWQTAVTARMPGTTPVAVKGETWAELARMAAALEPDGLWILHNHPSGNVAPSREDMDLTRYFAERHRGAPIAFKGHVILDHDKFAFMPPDMANGQTETRERNFSRNRASFHGEPTDAGAEAPLGTVARDAEGLMAVARAVAEKAAKAQEAARTPGAAITLIALSSNTAIRSVATVPMAELTGNLLADEALAQYATATGARAVFAFGDIPANDYPPEVRKRIISLVCAGLLEDFVFTDTTAMRQLRDAGMLRKVKDRSQDAVGVRVAEQSGPRFSVTSLLAGGDASREIGEAAEPTTADIARLLEMAQGGARWSFTLDADLSDENNARDFKAWIKSIPPAEMPKRLKDASPKSVVEWFEQNMVGKTFSFDIPGYGHREFTVKPGHIGKLVCKGGKKADGTKIIKGIVAKAGGNAAKAFEMAKKGELAASDIEGWDPVRAKSLPLVPVVLSEFDAALHETDRFGNHIAIFLKRFKNAEGKPNLVVMKLANDGIAAGPLSAHIGDLTITWLGNKNLLLTDEGEVYHGSANNSASRTPQAGDNAEGNSQASNNILAQSGGNVKRNSITSIADVMPDGARESITSDWAPGQASRADWFEAFVIQDRLRGIERPPEKYAELSRSLGLSPDKAAERVAGAEKRLAEKRESFQAGADIGASVADTAREIAREDFAKLVPSLFTGAAQWGTEIGGAAMQGWNDILRDMIARAPGYDLDTMKLDTGADLTKTLMSILPELFDPSEKDGGGGEKDAKDEPEDFVGPPTKETWEKWNENAAERRARYNRIIGIVKLAIAERMKAIKAREDAKARRAEETRKRLLDEMAEEDRQAENVGSPFEISDEEAEPDETMDAIALPREVVEGFGVDLANADEFASFMRAWVCDWLARKNPGTTYATVLDDPVALATYRRTMIAQLRDMATALLDPTEGRAAITAERMIADIRDNATADELERRTSDILSFIQRNGIRQRRKALIKDTLDMIQKMAVRGRKFDALERDMRRKVLGEHEAYARYIAKVIVMSDGAIERERAALQKIIDGREAAYDEAAEDGATGLDAASDVEIHKAMEKLAALQQYGGLKNRMPSYIAVAKKQLEAWLGGEREKHERRWAEFQAACDEVAEAVEKCVLAGAGKFAPDRPNLYERSRHDVLASVRQRLEEMMVGADTAGRREAIGRVMALFSEGSQKREQLKHQYRRQFETAMANAVKGTDLKVKDLMALLDEKIPEELNDLLDSEARDADGNIVHERQRVRMTWGQAMQLYASLRQTATYGENVALHGRQGHAEAIRKAAHPALLKLVDGLMRIYNERRGVSIHAPAWGAT